MTDTPEHKPDPKRWISVALLTLIALVFAGQSLGIPGSIKAEPGDGMVYWVAAEDLRYGNDMYEPEVWDNFGRPYIYPPGFAALFAPFTYFDDRPQIDPRDRSVVDPYPFPTSLYVWTALHGIAWAAGVWLLACALSEDRWQRLWLAAISSLGIWVALYMDADYGNINVFILLALIGGIALILRGKELAGGSVLGAAAMVKIMPGVLIIPLLLQKRWKSAIGMGIGAGALWLTPLVFTIPEHGLIDGVAQNFKMTGAYLSKWVLPRLQSGEFGQGQSFVLVNTSPSAALHRLFGEDVALTRVIWDENDLGPVLFSLPRGLIRLVGMLIPTAMFGLAVFGAFKRRDRNSQWGMLGLAFIAASAVNVLFWHYHFVGFALPIAACFAATVGNRENRKLAWFGLLCICGLGLLPHLLALEFDIRSARRLLVWGIPTLGMVGGWFALWTCLWRVKPEPEASESD